MSSRKGFAIATLVNAAWSIQVQAIAILVLNPFEYGQFAAGYILYTVLNVLVFAAVSDAWARANSRGGAASNWADYSSMLLLILAAATSLIVPVLLLLGPSTLGLPLVIAILSSGYRTGARYFAIAHGSSKHLIFPDVAAILVMSAVYFLLSPYQGDLAAICWAWAAGALSAAVASRTPKLVLDGVVRRWRQRHGRDMKLLLFDSFAVEGAGIGVPLLLASLMGPTSFGIYRAVSSAGIPVRLIINPLRPVLTRKPKKFFSYPKTLFAVLGGALALGGLTFGGLYIFHNLRLLTDSTLYELASHGAAAGLYVAASFVSSFYYTTNRIHLPARSVLILRLIQTLVSVAGPMSGYIFGALEGAILGFVLSSALNAIISVTAAILGPGIGRRRG